MSLSKIDAIYFKHDLKRLLQGDILRDYKITEINEDEDELNVQEKLLDYAVVITQDCDLEQDYKNRHDTNSQDHDKYLQSILLCSAYPAEKLREGIHLEKFDLKMKRIDSKRWQQLNNNNLYRYHYLFSYPDLQVPDLVIDFKHYFTVPIDILYKKSLKRHYIATIAELLREDLSNRFSQYLSRIGLPDLTKPKTT
jgi:hypothetical protein